MTIGCEVIKDLLPSYIDGLTSNESNELIEAHLEICDGCTDLYKSLKESDFIIEDREKNISDNNEVKLLKRIRAKLITIISTLIVTFLLFGIVIGMYGNVLFQEGNPIPLIKSIVELELNEDKFVRFSDDPISYISKSKIDRENTIIEYMNEKDWTYKEQMGSSYFFTRGEEEISVPTRQFTRYYFIWKVPAESTLDNE